MKKIYEFKYKLGIKVWLVGQTWNFDKSSRHCKKLKRDKGYTIMQRHLKINDSKNKDDKYFYESYTLGPKKIVDGQHTVNGCRGTGTYHDIGSTVSVNDLYLSYEEAQAECAKWNKKRYWLTNLGSLYKGSKIRKRLTRLACRIPGKPIRWFRFDKKDMKHVGLQNFLDKEYENE